MFASAKLHSSVQHSMTEPSVKCLAAKLMVLFRHDKDTHFDFLMHSFVTILPFVVFVKAGSWKNGLKVILLQYQLPFRTVRHLTNSMALHFYLLRSVFNRAGKSGWGGPDRIAGAGRWLPVSTYYLTSIVLD